MGKQPQCPSADEGISKMRSIHTLEYYSALKRKETRSPATTWMNHEEILLNETSQKQEDKYCRVPLVCATWTSQIPRDKVEGVGRREPGRGVGRQCFVVSVWEHGRW